MIRPHLKRNIDAVVAFDAPMTVVIGIAAIRAPRPRRRCARASRSWARNWRGGGTVTPAAVEVCRRGVRNVLSHLSVLAPSREKPKAPPPMFAIPGRGGHVLATAEGVFEPFHEHGAKVAAASRPGASTI